ncbi:hypothetical protein A9R05_44200 (plasmid) [Burkholderia sp. KK1]|uniref:ParB/Sulfiredoxin domain-containing protein n=1 Tax=Burkholderia sp. M701 TaxID=326454 RepID=V5YNM1_9BURK|nr:hypothetical protein [Burkholderia sp. M701]AQH05959.1 hypothetical protein A9R05_44200 [Burkholderia sp. KK1]BAO19190.1 hypothetical protein [Burkholderia sp. M701]
MSNIMMREVRTKVRAGDIVMHETPRAARVRDLVTAYQNEEEIPPIRIGSEKRAHWKTGPRGMEESGHGYFLADGHHRLAAFIEVFGLDAQIDVLMRRPVSQGDLTESPLTA